MLLVEHTLTLALSSFLPSFSAHLPPFSLPFLPLPAALLLSPSFFSFVSLILSQYIAQAGPELAILLCQSMCRDGRCAPAHPSFAEVCCCHLDSRTFMILLWRFYSFVRYLLLFVLNLCYTHGLKFAPQKSNSLSHHCFCFWDQGIHSLIPCSAFRAVDFLSCFLLTG